MGLTSRPEEEETGLAIQALDEAELELIAAFVWNTRLGQGISKYRDAAFTLMEKLEAVGGDDFLEEAAKNVDLRIDVMDYNGHLVQSITADT